MPVPVARRACGFLGQFASKAVRRVFATGKPGGDHVDGLVELLAIPVLPVVRLLFGRHHAGRKYAGLAGLSIIWPLLVAMLTIGFVYLATAMSRFRAVIFGS
jgi:hypothetical protein